MLSRSMLCSTIALAAFSSVALGEGVYHLDVNTLDATVVSGDTDFDVNFTGNLVISSQAATSIALAEFLGGTPAMFPDLTGFGFTLDLMMTNGMIDTGSINIMEDDNAYSASVMPGGQLFDADLAEIKLIGITFMGELDGVSDTDTFFDVAGLDKFFDDNGDLRGTFDELNLTPTSDVTHGTPFDTIVNIDVFITGTPIPLPAPVLVASAGLITLGGVRRRRLA